MNNSIRILLIDRCGYSAIFELIKHSGGKDYIVFLNRFPPEGIEFFSPSFEEYMRILYYGGDLNLYSNQTISPKMSVDYIRKCLTL